MVQKLGQERQYQSKHKPDGHQLGRVPNRGLPNRYLLNRDRLRMVEIVLRIPMFLHGHEVAWIIPEVIQEIKPKRLVSIAVGVRAKLAIGIVVITTIDGAGGVIGRVRSATVFGIHGAI